MTVSIPTAEQLAESIKAEVIALRDTCRIPATCSSFSELHDYCDANCLGDSEQLFEAIVTESATDKEHDAKLAQVWEIADPAMDIVDAWLKNGWK